MASPTVNHLNPTRAALPGLALVAVLLALFVGLGAGPAPAGAATLEPCEATNPTGPIVELDGQMVLSPTRVSVRALRRSGIRQSVIRPASNFTGRPEFPIKAAVYGPTRKVILKGGLRLRRGARSAVVRGLSVLVPAVKAKSVIVRAKVGRRTVNLLQVKGGKRAFSAGSGELSARGTARLTGAAAKVLNRSLRIKAKKLRAGSVWGGLDLFSLYKVTEVDDPTGEIPDAPPVKPEPIGASTVQSAAVVKWYVRDTFINYIASGEGTSVSDGATADPPSGSNDLVYSFNFPFVSGWTRPADGDGAENTLIKGSGTVGFRYCHNTINFTASDPEVEIDGDENSRLIFRVNGTDGTPYPDQRAVMVKLIPSQAQSYDVHPNGDGTTTVTYEKIPGFIPSESTGIFAGFYPAYSPEFEGQNPRPDRFGFFSVTYTFTTSSS